MWTVETQETSERSILVAGLETIFMLLWQRMWFPFASLKSLPEAKLSGFELITSAKEISRQPSIDNVTQLLLTTLLGICTIKKSKQGKKYKEYSLQSKKAPRNLILKTSPVLKERLKKGLMTNGIKGAVPQQQELQLRKGKGPRDSLHLKSNHKGELMKMQSKKGARFQTKQAGYGNGFGFSGKDSGVRSYEIICG